MKNLMWILGGVLWASVSMASLEFSLDCVADGASSPFARVIKVPYKNREGKWDARFFVEIKGRSGRLELVSAGSGDEDYLEYEVKTPVQGVNISGGAIQNRFQWASLTDNEGSSFAQCSKP